MRIPFGIMCTKSSLPAAGKDKNYDTVLKEFGCSIEELIEKEDKRTPLVTRYS